MPPMLRRLLVVFIAILLVLTFASIWLANGVPSPAPEAENAISTPVPVTGQVPIGGAFTLTNHEGAPVSEALLKGKISLVFFGFTHCPDICPTTLTTLTAVMEALGESGAQVQPILITVDPERDTPVVMKEYLKAFHPSVIGLTGTRAQVEAAVAAYRVYAAKQEPQAEADDVAMEQHGTHASANAHEGMDHGGSGYMVNHSGFIYLMGRQGEYLTHFSQGDSPQKIIETLRGYLS